MTHKALLIFMLAIAFASCGPAPKLPTDVPHYETYHLPDWLLVVLPALPLALLGLLVFWRRRRRVLVLTLTLLLLAGTLTAWIATYNIESYLDFTWNKRTAAQADSRKVSLWSSRGSVMLWFEYFRRIGPEMADAPAGFYFTPYWDNSPHYQFLQAVEFEIFPTSFLKTWGFQITHVRGRHLGRNIYEEWISITVPYWTLLLAPFLMFVLVWLVGLWHRHRAARRIAQGLCPKCAYDLRASKDRCPECGHPIPALPTAPITEKTP